MYRMMIIDDEPMVICGIKKIIAWEKYEIEICGEAEDGEEGLKKIIELMPDLALIDLKMPGMNGIDLIQRVKEFNQDILFIILTGFAEFEYARKAMELGVVNYILKPVDETKLLDIIMKTLPHIEQKRMLMNLKNKTIKNDKMECLRSLLFVSNQSMVLNYDLLKQLFKSRNYCVAVVQSKEFYIGMSLNWDMRIKTLLNNIRNVTVVTFDNKVALVSEDRDYKEFSHKLAENNEKLKMLYGTDYFITVGQNISNISDLHYSMECAVLLQEYQFIYWEQGVITIDIFKDRSDVDLNALFIQIGDFIQIGSIEKIKETIILIGDYLRQSVLKEQEIKTMVIQNTLLLQRDLQTKYDSYQIPFHSADYIRAVINHSITLSKLLEKGISYTTLLAKEIAKNIGDSLVEQILVYMESNYSSDLKVAEVAELFHYSNTYFGRIFKNATGKVFHQVLDEIRIEHAKEYLINTDMKIYQISKMVGYKDDDFFYEKFRKIVGLTAKKYRDKMRRTL